jgi:hypothetical protein
MSERSAFRGSPLLDTSVIFARSAAEALKRWLRRYQNILLIHWRSCVGLRRSTLHRALRYFIFSLLEYPLSQNSCWPRPFPTSQPDVTIKIVSPNVLVSIKLAMSLLCRRLWNLTCHRRDRETPDLFVYQVLMPSKTAKLSMSQK